MNAILPILIWVLWVMLMILQSMLLRQSKLHAQCEEFAFEHHIKFNPLFGQNIEVTDHVLHIGKYISNDRWKKNSIKTVEVFLL